MKKLVTLRQVFLNACCLALFVLQAFHVYAQVDSDVSDKTKQAYANLKVIQASPQFLFGQEFFNSYRVNSASAHGNNSFSDSNDVTGAHPAVLGSDFHYYLEKDPTERGFHTEAVKWAFQQGYIITFDWHVSGRGTNTYAFGETTKDLVDSIIAYPNGADRAWLYNELDKVISIINEDLVVDGERIPIIFRPWHEMNGDWFWWGSGATTPENYIAFYTLTIDYIKERTNSVLFAWSPNFPVNFDYYPGDDYVDLLGVDYYEINASNLRQQLGLLVDFAAPGDKVVVLSESGNRTANGEHAATYWNDIVLPALMEDPSGKSFQIAWVLTWINASWSYAYVPHSTSTALAKQSFLDFKNAGPVLFGNEIQNMYTPWSVVSVEDESDPTLVLMNLFPVPAEATTTIEIQGFELPTTVHITDFTGKALYHKEVYKNTLTISLDNFSSGLYIVTTADRSHRVSKKLLVK